MLLGMFTSSGSSKPIISDAMIDVLPSELSNDVPVHESRVMRVQAGIVPRGDYVCTVGDRPAALKPAINVTDGERFS